MRWNMRWPSYHKRWFMVGLFTAGVSAITASHAAPSKLFDTQKITAAYVYNFMQYAQWDVLPVAHLTLCVAGQNRDTLLLDQLDGKAVHQRKIEVAVVSVTSDLSVCQVLFVASSEYADLLDRAQNHSILVMTNIVPDNGRTTGLLLFTDKGRVSFEANLTHLERANIKLAASVLNLAKRTIR
jgi:hypothetical protein